MALGEKIKDLRKKRKWAQAELAKKIGVHVTHVSRLETSRYTPSLELLKKIAELFEVTTDYLLFESMDSFESVNLKDKTLYEKMKVIDSLADDDRIIITGVIDAFLVKQQMRNLLNKQALNKE